MGKIIKIGFILGIYSFGAQAFEFDKGRGPANLNPIKLSELRCENSVIKGKALIKQNLIHFVGFFNKEAVVLRIEGELESPSIKATIALNPVLTPDPTESNSDVEKETGKPEQMSDVVNEAIPRRTPSSLIQESKGIFDSLFNSETGRMEYFNVKAVNGELFSWNRRLEEHHNPNHNQIHYGLSLSQLKTKLEDPTKCCLKKSNQIKSCLLQFDSIFPLK